MLNHTYFTNIPLGFPNLGFPNLELLPSRNGDTHWEDQEQPLEDFLAIIKHRLKKLNSSQPTGSTSLLALGEIDYLPFSTLQAGIEKGVAVCRILLKSDTRENPDARLDHLINSIIDVNDKLAKAGQEKITSDNLREILQLKKSTDNFELNESNCRDLLREKGDIPIGTGFLVGRSYLLTNYHIINLTEEKYLNIMIAEFGYDRDSLGRTSEPVNYRFEKIEVFNENLDYALIKLNSNSEELLTKISIKKEAGDLFGFIQLNSESNAISPPIKEKILNEDNLRTEDKNTLMQIKKRLEILKNIDLEEFYLIPTIILQGEPAIMIQHPKGEYKQIVLTNNRVIKINKDFLYYETDSDHGSSGSPVFNQKWELVGMNRAAVYVKKEEEDPILIGYEGTRICKITEDLISKLNSEILKEMNLKKKDGTSSSQIQPSSRITNKPEINNLKGYFPSPEQF